jgi:hypothetical protein
MLTGNVLAIGQAGFILRRLGSLDEAQAAFRTFSEEASQTHPSRAQRLQAVTLGWTDGGARHSPPGAVPAVLPSRTDPQPSPARYSYVWDARPPDDWLALRSEPSARADRQLMRMSNGTLMDILEKRTDKLVASTCGWDGSGRVGAQ